MSGIPRIFGILLLLLPAFATGCGSHLPPLDFWGHRDSDGYQKLAAATQVVPPETECDATAVPSRPVTLQNFPEQQLWDVPLEEALRLALANSRIVRQLPLQQAPLQGGAVVPLSSDAVLRAPD